MASDPYGRSSLLDPYDLGGGGLEDPYKLPEIGGDITPAAVGLPAFQDVDTSVGDDHYKRSLFWPALKDYASGAMRGVSAVLGVQKQAIEGLFHAGLEAESLNPDLTIGKAVRSIVGLAPGQDANQGYINRLSGRAVEFSADIATDPLTWELGGLGSAVSEGRTAAQALEGTARLAPEALGALTPEAAAAATRAVSIGRAAAPLNAAAKVGFPVVMGVSAAQEGAQAYRDIKGQGITPATAEEAFGAGLSATAAALAAAHGLRGEGAFPEPGPLEGELVGNEALMGPRRFRVRMPRNPMLDQGLPDIGREPAAGFAPPDVVDAEIVSRQSLPQIGQRALPPGPEEPTAPAPGPVPEPPGPTGGPLALPPAPPGAQRFNVDDAVAQRLESLRAKAAEEQAPAAPAPAEPAPPAAEERRGAQPAMRERINRYLSGQELPRPEVEQLIRDLQTHADTDPMTGLGNRARWERRRGEAPHVQEPTLAMDVGGLGWINDTHGHPTGDRFIKELGATMRDVLEEQRKKYPDLEIDRTGGDEFMATGAPPEALEEVGKAIAKAVAEMHLEITLPDGTLRRYKGVRLDYGPGPDEPAADATLYTRRKEAAARGERATVKGQRPPSIVEVTPEGEPHRVPPPGEEKVAPTLNEPAPEAGGVAPAPAETEPPAAERAALLEPGVERIRGSSDIPLPPEGHAQNEQTARALAGAGGLDKLYVPRAPHNERGLRRMEDTAATIQRAGAAREVVSHMPDTARSWDLGGLEGKPVAEAGAEVNRLIRAGDEAPGGMGPFSTHPGESFDRFVSRIHQVGTGLIREMDRFPERKIGIVINSRPINVLKSLVREGDTKLRGAVSRDEMIERGEQTPEMVTRLSRNRLGGLEIGPADLSKPLGPGVYLIRHGATAWNKKPGGGPSTPPPEPAPQLPVPAPQTVEKSTAPTPRVAPEPAPGGRYGALRVRFEKRPVKAVRTALRAGRFRWDSEAQEWSAPEGNPAARPALEAAVKRGGEDLTAAKAPAKPAPAPPAPEPAEEPGRFTFETMGWLVKGKPTEPQKEAGNYQKGHVRIAGLDISIENPEGSKRREEWPVLKSHYGYIRGTVGPDKDHIDVFVKPGTPEDYDGPVFVVNQTKADGSFDEHKVMLGYSSKGDAKASYLENYTRDFASRNQGIATFENPLAFRQWLERGDTKKPVGNFTAMKSVPIVPVRGAGGRVVMGAGKPEIDYFEDQPIRAKPTLGTVEANEESRYAGEGVDLDFILGEQEDRVRAINRLQERAGSMTDLQRKKSGINEQIDALHQNILDTFNEVESAAGEEAANKMRAELPRWATVPRAPREEEPAPSPEPETSDRRVLASSRLADWVAERLGKGSDISASDLESAAIEQFGGTRGGGKYTPKDAYDALELGVNRYLLKKMENWPLFPSMKQPENVLASLRTLLQKLPTQTTRTAEQQAFQQFSTPPTEAFVAAYALAPRAGETVLEPSAGTGGLAVFPAAAQAKLVLNELAPRRLELLRAMFGDDATYTAHDAEHLHALERGTKVDAVLMNPPFSATGGRTAYNATKFGGRHVEAALQMLKPGGRLVAIVGEGMRFPGETTRVREASGEAFRAWWAKTMAKYNVRANLGVSGEEYGKYGTTFGNQILVIDNTGPTPGADWNERLQSVRQGTNMSLEDALAAVRSIHDDRPGTLEADRGAARPGARRPVEPSGAVGLAGRPEPTGRPVGTPEPRGGGGAGAEVGRGPAEPGRPGEVERPGPRGGRRRNAPVEQQTGPPGGVADEDQPTVPITKPAEAARAPRVKYEVVKRVGQPKAVDEAGSFMLYEPQLKVAGKQEHPAEIVETASMAIASMPDPTYQPALPESLVASGALSPLQLEAPVYAGQAHEQRLESGERRGYFIGDGTGVGKGRQIAAIVYDNHLQGRKRALWLSVSRDLMEDATRDLTDLGAPIDVKFHGDWKPGDDIDMPQGVVFSTYSTFVKEAKGQRAPGAPEGAPAPAGPSRLAQAMKWLGDDGVLIFDEAHAAKNLVSGSPMRGGRQAEGSQRGRAVVDIQTKMPNARVVYVSATGATEPRNMAYMTRLGLWGPGTPFADFGQFLSQVGSAGLGAMEIVARDAKALGLYSARQISYTGTEFTEQRHMLNERQQEMYNAGARSWQKVLQNVEKAIEITGAGPMQKAMAKSQLWGAQQRFWSQLITAFKVPLAIREAEAALKNKESVVINLINTLEARTKERIAEARLEERELDDLDLGPKDALLSYLNKAFPTDRYEEYTDEFGQKSRRPVLDANGNPVEDPEAAALRDDMLAEIARMQFPEGPLDQVVNHFGPDGVAEISGRKRRLMKNPDTGKVEWVSRASKGVPQKRVNISEMAAFNAGKRRVAIVTPAGSTGISLHADRRFKNQQRRVFLSLQLPWSADTMLQFYGRVHRSNQAVAPRFVLLSSDVGGERRFSSTIASRLASLGALSRGQRDAAGAGELAKYNFDSTYGEDAVAQTLKYLETRSDEGPELLYKMGLVKKQGDAVADADLSNMERFLNRVLALELPDQEKVFNFFMDRFDRSIADAKARGTFDEGVTDVKGDNPRLVKSETIARTGNAETTHNVIQLDRRTNPVPWEVAKAMEDDRYKNPPAIPGVAEGSPGTFGFYKQKRSGRVVYAEQVAPKTDAATGLSVPRMRITTPAERSAEIIDRDELFEKYDPGTTGAFNAEKEWRAAVAKIPEKETVTEHILGGVLMPIWDRITGVEGMRGAKVVRVVTDAGERVVGMRIPAKHVDQVLRAVGATTSARGPEETFNHVLEDGGTVALAGGHQLARRRVAGEQRIEFIPKDKWAVNRGEMDRLGLIEEQIQFARRYFVPNEEAAGVPVLDKILKRWPALEGGGPEAGGGGIKPPGGGPRSMASMADDARERLRARGRNNTANDLGSAAAQGAGTFRDLAIIGAELLGRGIRRFGTWAREMAAAVGDFVVGLGDRLRQVWNQAQALFRQKRREGATAATPEAEARGAAEKEGIPFVKTRAMRDRLRDLGYSDRQFDRMTPEEAYRTMNEGRPAGAGPRVAGERTPPGARPRVDTKVEELRDIAPGVKLSRDAPRTWKSLDPTIQNIIDRVLSDPEREAAFYSKARSGKLSDAEIQALDAIVSGKREAADTLRAELNNATGAAADRARAAFVRAAYDQAIADLAKAARSDVEAGTRLARALAARARVMEAAGVSTPEQLLRRVFREIPDITDAQAAELVDILQNDPAKLTDALIALTKPSFFKKWLEFWKAGLVSAPGTQVANILGNVGEASLRPAESAIASLLDRLVPGGASRLKGEARAELLGSVRGALAGLGDLGATLRDIAALRPEEIDLTQPLERQVPAIGGAWGRFIRTPFRLLGAFDDWFKEIGGSAELHKLAWRRAGGDAARAAEIMADPPADLVKQVVFARKARTFQDPNRLAEDIIRLRNDQPWLHLIAPFVRTPANIARAAWQRSPAGFWAGYKALSRYRQAIGGGADAAQLARLKGEAVDALSKPILGTMILGSFAVAAKAGHMTGSGPVNPNERNALRDTGWQPYSFVVDVDGVPTYVPYNRFEPVSTLLGISADMVEAADQKTAGDLFDKGIGSIVQNFISKTYLQGLADAAEFINDPKRFASQYLSGFASSTVPNIVRKAAQAYDPIVRETKPTTPGIAGIPERLVRSVQSGVPGLSERLPARKTITGEPVERPEAEAGVAGALARFALPSIPTSEKPEAQLEKVMNAVGYVPSPPSRTVTIPGGRGRKMQLTDDDVATLDEGDQKAAQILQAYLEGGRFDRLPDTVEEGGKRSKEGVIRQVYEEQRDLARRRLFRDPDFRARMRDQNTSMTEAFEEARP